MRYKLGIKKSVEIMMDGGYSGKDGPLCYSRGERDVHFCVEVDKMVSICLLEDCLKVA